MFHTLGTEGFVFGAVCLFASVEIHCSCCSCWDFHIGLLPAFCCLRFLEKDAVKTSKNLVFQYQTLLFFRKMKRLEILWLKGFGDDLVLRSFSCSFWVFEEQADFIQRCVSCQEIVLLRPYRLAGQSARALARSSRRVEAESVWGLCISEATDGSQKFPSLRCTDGAAGCTEATVKKSR